MKRIRNDEIDNLVESYLRKRQFSHSDGHGGLSFPSVEGIEKMVSRKLIENETSVLDSIKLSSTKGDASSLEEQYLKFQKLIGDVPNDEIRSELSTVLFPVCLHVYLQMLSNGHRGMAILFFSHHVRSIVPESHRSMLAESDTEGMNTDALQDVKTNKMVVHISKESFQTLKKLLVAGELLCVLEILNEHVKIVSRVKRTPVIETDPGERPLDIPLDEKIVPENRVILDEQKLSDLKRTIAEVQKKTSSLGSLCVLRVKDVRSAKCICGSISNDFRWAAVGNEDSSITLWNEPGTVEFTEQNLSGVSRITLSGDVESNSKDSVARSCVTLRGHGESVFAVRFSNDSRHVLSASGDATVRLWDLNTQENVVLYRGHQYPVFDVALSPLPDLFASSSFDHSARLWTFDRTTPIRTFCGHLDSVDRVVFHPNGSYLATGSSDKTIRMWSVNDGKSVRLFQGHSGDIYSLSFSPDGKYLLSAGEDRTIRIWDLASGLLWKQLSGHLDWIYSMCAMPLSGLLVSGGMESSLLYWDIWNNHSAEAPVPEQPELFACVNIGASSVLALVNGDRNDLWVMAK